jgi:hypothetical protein
LTPEEVLEFKVGDVEIRRASGEWIPLVAVQHSKLPMSYPSQYRLKPKPRVLRVMMEVGENGNPVIREYAGNKWAMLHSGNFGDSTCITFVEQPKSEDGE